MALFNAFSANDVEANLMRIWPYNDLLWPDHEQFSAQLFSDKYGTNLQTSKGWKVG